MNTHVRDTFISQAAFDAIPINRQLLIQQLVQEYHGLGYISAWNIGADQWARTSKRQADKMQKTRLRVFRIEEEITALLKTDEQLAQEAEAKAAKELEQKRQYLQNRIGQLRSFCQRKLDSKRDNGTKREYHELVAELEKLC